MNFIGPSYGRFTASQCDTEKCVEADMGDSAEISSEDLDEGVMPVAFSDSDWEQVNYEEDSAFIEGPRRSVEIIDEDGIGPCEMPEDDILYGSDNDDANNFGFGHAAGSMSSSGIDVDFWLTDAARRRVEAARNAVLKSRIYCKYIRGNCMKQAALFTTLILSFLPLILMVLVTVMAISLMVSLCLVIPVAAFSVGIVLTIMWNVWVFIPLFLLLAAVWIGADIFEKLFMVPKRSSPPKLSGQTINADQEKKKTTTALPTLRASVPPL